MDKVTIKSSTIFISVGNRTEVFQSIDDVPPDLRRKLQESTNGINAATILIADKRGREEIVKAIQGLPNGVRSRIASSLGARPEPVKGRLDWRTWLEILLPAAVGLLIWLAFSAR